MQKTFVQLSETEIRERLKLTPDEKRKMSAFLKASLALPDTLCIDVDGFENTLYVCKRITHGCCQKVGRVKKKSLFL